MCDIIKIIKRDRKNKKKLLTNQPMYDIISTVKRDKKERERERKN
jgi:hypothetical protein